MSLRIAPSRGWINDPNGLTFVNGRWHVFFQHNPAAPVHADVHWGHVSSPDLLTWTEHPVAFGPQPGGPDSVGSWSGVFATDGEHGAAVYTSVHDRAENSTVSVRWALDPELLTFSEPIVVAETPAEVWQMRDPFLFRFGDHRYAAVGAGLADGRPAIVLFGCDDLLEWTYLGIWLTSDAPGAHTLGPANIWECPQLVQIDGTWVLVLSLWHDHVLGQVEYLTLDLAAKSATGAPVPTVRASGPVDLGVAYAPQVLADPAPPGSQPLMITWVRHPGLPDADPNAWPAPVAGCLGLPQRLTLDGDRLVVRPDERLASILGPARPLPDTGPVELPAVAQVCGAGLSGARLAGEGADTHLPVGTDELWVDGDVAEAFTTGPSVTLRSTGGPWSVTATGPLEIREPS